MKPKNGFMTLMAVAAATVCIIAAIPTVSWSADDMELPNGGKVDLGRALPGLWNDSRRRPRGRGHPTRNRNDRAVGFAGVAAVAFKDGQHPSGLKAPAVSLSTTRFRKGSASTWTTSLIDSSRISPTRKIIDVNNAFLILGSTVRGPMGYELIPFSNKGEAEKFEAEYKGKRLVQLQTVELKDVDRPRKPLDTKP